jgi:hypothetical protein
MWFKKVNLMKKGGKFNVKSGDPTVWIAGTLNE